ncbi:unnamed protein product [Chrysodeixis includens]|uniref:Hemolin n=1 Tax=Chrysodeixis includens TaxID=689277 RepID=A0A9P0FRM3_CHRIL|nr:unnamed protein product [Chrysodeixis includens]
MAVRIKYILLFLLLNVYTNHASYIIKGSLTFVIDNTGSMWDEIDQVKEEANAIFETVLKSNASQIENFILVTFNDPDAKLRIVTKDREKFKLALAGITVYGGGDCPEYAMTGIETALASSLPYSYLFVFTDASAKDHSMYEKIKSICQKKQSQVIFVLTGICGSRTNVDYQVYHQIADATNGQVFHVEKHEVKDVLDYVKEVIKSRGTVVSSKHFPPGYNNTMKYDVDGDTEETIIVVTGDKPKIGKVTGPGGSRPKTEVIMNKPQTAIVKVTDAKPGEHEVEVGSKSSTHAVVTAKISINIELGFSVFRPTSIKDTVSRPPPDGQTFLTVQLLGDQAVLKTAKIIDMSDNVIAELPLELVNKEEKLYLSPLFNPPNTMFRVSVSGYDEKSKTPITRTSPTPIERQSLKTETIKNVSPQVTLEGGPKMTTEYGETIEITCKVHGYPKPDIIWEEEGSGIRLPATVSLLEVPYDYVSILKIENTENKTYQCKGSNSLGSDVKSIEVEVTSYFNIVEAPKADINIKYNEEGSIVCKVDAKPPATITWLKDGRDVTLDDNTAVSSDNTILTIKHMKPNTTGNYICEARNEKIRKVFFSNVTISGLEKPSISEDYEGLVEVHEGDDVQIFCRVTGGKPKPKIQWLFSSDYVDETETEAESVTIHESSEELQFKNITKKQGGDYACIATNEAGSASMSTYIMVLFPPIITDKAKDIVVKDGDEVVIPCNTDAEPAPDVTWYKDGVPFTNKKDPASKYGLRFQATVADSGHYTCKAINKLGSANKTVSLTIFAPVSIEVPKVSKINTMVGQYVKLPCRADGHPSPRITWAHTTDSKIPPKNVTPLDESRSDLQFRNIQLNQQGFYTCVANNGFGKPTSIQYEIIVNAPPIIENVYMDKTFKVVEGDLVLRIQCKATGNPKPTIIWKKNDLSIAYGSEWYDMEKDGTLVIKNVDKKSRGTYVCLAENAFGKDSELFEVEVNKYPTFERPFSTIILNSGVPTDLKCDIPHTKTDQLRWYKDGVLRATGELRLEKPTLGDEGLYTCRVSDFTKSRSKHLKVQVGYKPEFLSIEEDEIDFSQGNYIMLVCEAKGYPRPKVTWKHNGKKLDESSMFYDLELTMASRGTYECEVSNELGTIKREFRIKSRDCILDIKEDFSGYHPLLLSPSLKRPTFEIIDGYMIIPNKQYAILNCPSKFVNFASQPLVRAFCEGDENVKIKGKTYAFPDIKCRREMKPEELRTGITCLPGNTEYVKIGFNIMGRFYEVYKVCLDKDNLVPVFTKQMLPSDQANSSEKSRWFSSDLLPFDFYRMYDCRHQAVDIGSTFGRDVTSHSSCCFGKRQLVNPHDLPPGVPATTAYSYLNVIPQWSSCESKNWQDVEDRVRKLAKSAGRDLSVTTGASNPIRRPRSAMANVSLHDDHGGKQPVAEYVWKIVQDRPSSASLAIIQVNIPGLSNKAAPRYVMCRDICSLIEWMNNDNWHNVDDGFTYCCTIDSFEKAFGFERIFSSGMQKVLYDAYVLPENYMTI